MMKKTEGNSCLLSIYNTKTFQGNIIDNVYEAQSEAIFQWYMHVHIVTIVLPERQECMTLKLVAVLRDQSLQCSQQTPLALPFTTRMD